MHRHPVTIAVMAMAMMTTVFTAHASTDARPSSEQLMTFRATKRFAPDIKVPKGAFVVSRTIVDGYRTTVLKIDAGNIASLKKLSQKGSYAVTVQPNYPYRAFFTPNDPSYPLQWHLSKSSVPRAWDFDMTAPMYGGDPSVIVAVLDTGVSYEDYLTFKKAPDFASTNFIAGYDFVNSDDHPNDDNGHGTHITMTIAQSANNSISGAGIAHNVTIMPIKVLDAAGNGSTATIAAGIDYARVHGAKIINLSLGGTENDVVLRSAVQNAVASGITVVAATGNDGVGTIYYPAQYEEVIAVGAVRYDETRAHYSNYGAGIDLVASGGDLDVDQNDDGQPDGILQQTCTTSACDSFDDLYYEGTSQAAPQVSATVALLLSAGIDVSRIPSILQSSARDLGGTGYDTTFGWGLLDVGQALTIGVNDIIAPSGTIVIGDGRPYVRTKEVAVAISASDVGSSVADMSFSNNGSSFSPWEPYATAKTWDMTEGYGASTSDGSKTIYARFRDAAGNVSTAAAAAVVLDRVKPATPSFNAHAQPPSEAVTISSGAPTSLKSPMVEWESSDALSGMAGYRTEYTKNPRTDFDGGATDVARSYLMPTFTVPTTAYMRVVAVDNAGNQSASASFAYVYRPSKVVLGVSSSTGSTVVLADTSGSVSSRYAPYGKWYTYGINVASVVAETERPETIVVAPLRGQTKVKVLNSRGAVVTQFSPYGSAATGGIDVAVGERDEDGRSTIIVTPVKGRLPLRLFSIDGTKLDEWYPYGKAFSKGFSARLLRTKDGTSIVTVPRTGSTLIRLFSVQGRLKSQWYGFSKQASFGLNIATGDVNADGNDEIAVAPIEGAPQVKVYAVNKKLLGQFFAFSKTSRTGVVLAMADLNGQGREAIFVAPARGTARLKCVDVKGRSMKKCKVPSSLPSGDISISEIR